jgi:hypothetical protein
VERSHGFVGNNDCLGKINELWRGAMVLLEIMTAVVFHP